MPARLYLCKHLLPLWGRLVHKLQRDLSVLILSLLVRAIFFDELLCDIQVTYEKLIRN